VPAIKKGGRGASEWAGCRCWAELSVGPREKGNWAEGGTLARSEEQAERGDGLGLQA